MIKKTLEKEKALKLRRGGETYSAILSKVPVAKSTLALWLKEANLSTPENHKFTERKRLASLRGGQAKKKQRIDKQNKILAKSKSEIGALSYHELFIIGTMLYWAEGSKEKEYQPGSTFAFSNMDPRMIKIMLIWLFKVCKINKNMLIFNIFLHETHRARTEEIKRFWAKITGFPVDNFGTIYWKKNKLSKTKRRNTEALYHGVLKIKVRQSSELVRKIAGWSEGIFEKIIKK